MGRWAGSRFREGRPTTGAYRAFDVRRLRREGLLSPGQRYRWCWVDAGTVAASVQVAVAGHGIQLHYVTRGDGHAWRTLSYLVHVDWTPCHFGGHRPWFLCPARGCGRRVAILYAGGVFACRRCHRLAYASTRVDAGERAALRAERLRERLGWEPGILNGDGPRPKGMHRRTYARLTALHEGYVGRSVAAVSARFAQAGVGLEEVVA